MHFENSILSENFILSDGFIVRQFYRTTVSKSIYLHSFLFDNFSIHEVQKIQFNSVFVLQFSSIRLF